MSVSVIIATYNRAALLNECLHHLSRQRFEPGDEVIVVDNGSTDDTSAVIQRHQCLWIVPLRHVEEPMPGKSLALGRAIGCASGDILALTDDDVTVDAGWLDAIRAAMAGGEVALVGGPVAPSWEGRAPRWLRVHRGSYGRLAAPLAILDYGTQASELGARTAIGANLAVRRDVAAHVGGFAPHLGKLRGTLLSGEDHDFCRRVQAAGFRAVYCPEARVHHFVPARRARVSYVLDWFFWSGITNVALDATRRGTGRSIAGLPLYLVRRFIAALALAPWAFVTGRFDAALDRAADAAFTTGYASRAWGFINLQRQPTADPEERPARGTV